MCHISYREVIEQEVIERTRRRERFTAYTITQALREQGFREPHSVLKEVVHCLFRYGKMPKTYRRTFVHLPNGCEAFLFHHYRDTPEAEPAADTTRRGSIWLASQKLFGNCFGVSRSRAGVSER